MVEMKYPNHIYENPFLEETVSIFNKKCIQQNFEIYKIQHLLSITLLFFSCASLHAQEKEYRICGSNSVCDILIPELVTGYVERHSYNLVNKPISNTELDIIAEKNTDKKTYTIISTGTEDILNERLHPIHMGISTRHIENHEFIGKSRGLWVESLVALDTLVVIASPDIQLKSISLDKLKNYLLGYKNNEITLHLRNEKSSANKIYSKIANNENYSQNNNIELHETDSELSTAILDGEKSIGIISMSHIDNNKILGLEDKCGTDYIELPHDTFSVANKTYPLTRSVYIYTRDKDPDIESFLKYIQLDEEATKLISNNKFTVLKKVYEKSYESQKIRFSYSEKKAGNLSNELSKLQKKLVDARQLSTSVYFGSGDSKLNKDSIATIDKNLLTYLDKNRINEIILVGYADDLKGTDSNNIKVSKERANNLRDHLKKEKINKKITTFGIGVLANIGCNNRESKSYINRRVEVWVR